MTRYRKSKNDVKVDNGSDRMVTLTELNSDTYKVYLKFGVHPLNCIIGLILNMDKPYVSFKVLQTAYNLFQKIDEVAYKTDDKLKSRFDFINTILHHIIIEDNSLMNWKSLSLYIDEEFRSETYSDIINNLDEYRDMDEKSINQVYKLIQDRLNYIHLLTYKDPILNTFQRLVDNDFDSYKEINDQLKGVLSALLSNMKRIDTLNAQTTELSLMEDIDDKLREIISRIRDSNRVLHTGKKMMNAMLSPGYIGSNLYIYLGLPNGGKTATLVDELLSIKRYNPDIETKTPGFKPTLLFISMEDTIDKLVSRMFSKLVASAEIEDENISVEELIKLIKTEGGLNFETDNINIEIKYFSNRAIDTSDVYGIIEEMKNEKKEVIALFLDYVKRIKPAEYAKEERDELKNISNELRNIAVAYDIPVITAHQLNREAMDKVTAALDSRKDNAAGNINLSQIGNSFAIVENADWIAAIMKETDANDKPWMVYKKLKIRYKDLFGVMQFAQPFSEDGRRVIEDQLMPGDQNLSIPYVSKRGVQMKDFDNYSKPSDSSTITNTATADNFKMDDVFFQSSAINTTV